jgi:hypothetical protein
MKLRTPSGWWLERRNAKGTSASTDQELSQCRFRMNMGRTRRCGLLLSENRKHGFALGKMQRNFGETLLHAERGRLYSRLAVACSFIEQRVFVVRT